MADLDVSVEHQTSDIFFEPVISLPVTTVSNAEENETCLFNRRAKLYRFDRAEDPPEWKERGTGNVKILQHKETGQYRILMRRDRTLKVCANHFINSSTDLRANCGSDRAFVWQTLADFADEVPKSESLGIRFPDEETARLFKELFEKGRLCAVDHDKEEKCKTEGDDNGIQPSEENADSGSSLAEALKSLRVESVKESGDQERSVNPAVVATT